MSFNRNHPDRRNLGLNKGLPPIGNGFSFYSDGTNEYITDGNPAALKFAYPASFTMAGWIQPKALVGSRVIMRMDNTATVGYQCWLTSTGRIQAGIIYDLGGNYRSTFTRSDISVDNWYFFAATFLDESQVIETYLNGVYNKLGTSDGGSPSNGLPTFTSSTFIIGGNPNGTGYGYFNGYLHNLTLWNKRLNGAEIMEAYNGGVPPDLTLHTAYANLVHWMRPSAADDFTNGGTVNDYSTQGNNGIATNTEATDKVSIVP